MTKPRTKCFLSLESISLLSLKHPVSVVKDFLRFVLAGLGYLRNLRDVEIFPLVYLRYCWLDQAKVQTLNHLRNLPIWKEQQFSVIYIAEFMAFFLVEVSFALLVSSLVHVKIRDRTYIHGETWGRNSREDEDAEGGCTSIAWPPSSSSSSVPARGATSQLERAPLPTTA